MTQVAVGCLLGHWRRVCGKVCGKTKMNQPSQHTGLHVGNSYGCSVLSVHASIHGVMVAVGPMYCRSSESASQACLSMFLYIHTHIHGKTAFMCSCYLRFCYWLLCPYAVTALTLIATCPCRKWSQCLHCDGISTIANCCALPALGKVANLINCLLGAYIHAYGFLEVLNFRLLFL